MKYHYRIRLADTDAAGRIYFASASRIAHEAFEALMEVIGFGIDELIQKGEIGLPVVHAEASFRQSLKLGNAVDVHTKVSRMGDRSLTFTHSFLSGSDSPVITVTITHAVISAKTGKAIKIPPALKKALKSI